MLKSNNGFTLSFFFSILYFTSIVIVYNSYTVQQLTIVCNSYTVFDHFVGLPLKSLTLNYFFVVLTWSVMTSNFTNCVFFYSKHFSHFRVDFIVQKRSCKFQNVSFWSQFHYIGFVEKPLTWLCLLTFLRFRAINSHAIYNTLSSRFCIQALNLWFYRGFSIRWYLKWTKESKNGKKWNVKCDICGRDQTMRLRLILRNRYFLGGFLVIF